MRQSLRLLALAMFLAGCASRPLPVSAPAPRSTGPTTRAAPLPAVHTLLRLVEPAAGIGEIVMTLDPPYGTTSQGAIRVVIPESALAFVFQLTRVDLGVHGLRFGLANPTPGPVTVLWDQASLTGPNGLSHRVVHQGIRLVDRNAPMAPTTIPPGGTIEDFVFPSELITFQSGRYSRGWTYSQFFELLAPAQTVMFYLPLRIAGEPKDYIFRFQASR